MNEYKNIKKIEEMSRDIYSDEILDSLLDLINETTTQVMQVRASSLMLADKKKNTLYFKAVTGEKKNEIKKFEIKIGQGIAGIVAQKGEPLIVENVKDDPRWHKDISESLKFPTQSIACVPMKISNEIIGVIEVIDKENGDIFNKDDLNRLSTYALLAATAIGNARNMLQVRRENQELKEELNIKYNIIGNSPAIKKVISDALKVADSNVSAIILGESGTGKELLSRLIHREGKRKNKPMVVLNCAALPENLLEDELFGHEKGAYTGAVGKKIGKFELADEGTIFLDEIGEMNFGMQAKLLRVLEEGIFFRIGGNDTVSVDVRVLSATNRDIEKEVKEGRFRDDLYYRLNVVQIYMPPLRQRKEDIPLLAEYFLKIFGREKGLFDLSISDKALEKMVVYDWPGNVRELSNSIERAVVMGNGKEIRSEDLPITESKTKYSGMDVNLTLEDAINEFKKEFIKLNLKNTNGVKSKAAVNMGIQRTYLSRLISRYDIT